MGQALLPSPGLLPRTTSSLPRASGWQISFPYKPCVCLASWWSGGRPYPQLISQVSVAHGVPAGPRSAAPFLGHNVPFPGLSLPPSRSCPCAGYDSRSPPPLLARRASSRPRQSRGSRREVAPTSNLEWPGGSQDTSKASGT